MDRLDQYKVREHLHSMDLTRVKKRLRRWGCSRTEVQEGIEYYRKYLFVRWYTNAHCPPSESIAKVWQAHILETDSYLAMSQHLFGEYLHYISPNKKPNLFDEITQPAFYQIYGYYIPQILNRHWYENLMYFVRRIGVKLSSFVVISAIITAAYSSMVAYNADVNHKYQSLVDSIRQSIITEENLAITCQSDIKSKYPNFYISTLYESRKNLRKNLLKSVGLGLDLKQEGIITPHAIKTLQSFNQWIDKLYYAGNKVCQYDLKQEPQSKKYRRSVVDQMNESRKQYLWFFNWLDSSTLLIYQNSK